MKTIFVLAFILATIWVTDAATTFEVDTSAAKDLTEFGQQVKKTCEDWYPKIAKFLNTPGYKDPETVPVKFEDNDGVAYASGGRIVGSINYFREHKDDVGAFVHETVHIVQKYPDGCPFWFVEGMADYIRYYQYQPERKPGKPGKNNSYKQGYGIAAYFINFIRSDRSTRNGVRTVMKAHRDCREGKYQDSVWQQGTGKNLDALWSDMQKRG